MQNVAFILPFVLLIPMWVGISHLLARISGWHRLATVYRASESAGGQILRVVLRFLRSRQLS